MLTEAEKAVNRIFPGRYAPVIFLWLLLATLTYSIWNEESLSLMYGVAVILFLVSYANHFRAAPPAEFDIAGQILIFSFFLLAKILKLPGVEHLAVLLSILYLMNFKIRNRVPLGPSLLFIAVLIPVENVPLALALVFPIVIVVGFAKDQHTLPPFASLAAAGIYLVRIGAQETLTTRAFLFTGIGCMLIVTIYAFRAEETSHVRNPIIHFAEDSLVYFFLLSAAWMLEIGSAIEEYTALAIVFFILSCMYLWINRLPEFVSAAIVANLALLPAIHEKMPEVLGPTMLAIKTVCFCLIAVNLAIVSRLFQTRLPSQFAKLILIGTLIFFYAEIESSRGLKHLYDTYSTLVIVSLSVMVTLLSLRIGHMDLHRPYEGAWAGIVPARALAAGRSLGRSSGNHLRSLPLIGFWLSSIAVAIELFRRAFGSGRRRLTTSHYHQVASLAVFFAIFGVCLQRVIEIGYGGPVPTASSTKCYPAEIRIYSASLTGLLIFAAGSFLRLPYLRLLALLVSLPFIAWHYFACSEFYLTPWQTPIIAISCLFVLAYILSPPIRRRWTSRPLDRPEGANSRETQIIQ